MTTTTNEDPIYTQKLEELEALMAEVRNAETMISAEVVNMKPGAFYDATYGQLKILGAEIVDGNIVWPAIRHDRTGFEAPGQLYQTIPWLTKRLELLRGYRSAWLHARAVDRAVKRQDRLITLLSWSIAVLGASFLLHLLQHWS